MESNRPLKTGYLAIALVGIGFAGTAESFTKDDLKSRVVAHRASLGGYEYTAELKFSAMPAEDPSPSISVDREVVHCKSVGRAIYADSKTYIADTLHGSFLSAFDGSLYKYVRPVSARAGRPAHLQGGIRETESVASYATDVVTRTMLWCTECDPERASSVLKDVLVLLDAPHTEIDQEIAELFGSQCVRIHGGNGITVWLDIDHGGIVRRIDYFNARARTSENLTVRKEIPQLLEIEGRYFPAIVREYVFLPGSTNPESLEGTPVVRHRMDGTVDPASVRFDVHLDDVDITFPDGAIVIDARTGMDFIAGDVTEERRKELRPLLSVKHPRSLPSGAREQLIYTEPEKP